jgi:hypothetical protein
VSENSLLGEIDKKGLGIVLKTINNEVYNLSVPVDLPITELKQIVRVSGDIL